MEALGGLE